MSQVSARHDAISDWEQKLSKRERFRISPILAIELEKLWQTANAILFVGSIKDVSSSGTKSYEVLVEQCLYNMDYMFASNRSDPRQ